MEEKGKSLGRRSKLENARAEGKWTDRVGGFETGSHEEALFGVVVHAVLVEDEAHRFPCLQISKQT